MNRMTALTGVLIAGLLPSLSCAQILSCKLSEYDIFGIIEVQVAYKFTDPALQADWVYRSLNPRLVYSSGVAEPERQIFADGELKSLFCLKETRDFGATWEFRTGARSYSIKPRPTTESTVLLGTTKQQIKIKRMPLIRIVDEKVPEWVILKDARWLVAKDGSLRLDVELFNPTGYESGGGMLSLDFARPRHTMCSVGPEYKDPTPIPVEIKVQAGNIQVASADADYGELIHRDASYKPEGCLDVARVNMSIGPSSRTPARSSIRTRYAIHYRVTDTTSKQAGNLAGLPKDFLAWPSVLSIESGQGFPMKIQITGADK